MPNAAKLLGGGPTQDIPLKANGLLHQQPLKQSQSQHPVKTLGIFPSRFCVPHNASNHHQVPLHLHHLGCVGNPVSFHGHVTKMQKIPV